MGAPSRRMVIVHDMAMEKRHMSLQFGKPWKWCPYLVLESLFTGDNLPILWFLLLRQGWRNATETRWRKIWRMPWSFGPRCELCQAATFDRNGKKSDMKTHMNHVNHWKIHHMLHEIVFYGDTRWYKGFYTCATILQPWWPPPDIHTQAQLAKAVQYLKQRWATRGARKNMSRTPSWQVWRLKTRNEWQWILNRGW